MDGIFFSKENILQQSNNLARLLNINPNPDSKKKFIKFTLDHMKGVYGKYGRKMPKTMDPRKFLILMNKKSVKNGMTAFKQLQQQRQQQQTHNSYDKNKIGQLNMSRQQEIYGRRPVNVDRRPEYTTLDNNRGPMGGLSGYSEGSGMVGYANVKNASEGHFVGADGTVRNSTEWNRGHVDKSGSGSNNRDARMESLDQRLNNYQQRYNLGNRQERPPEPNFRLDGTDSRSDKMRAGGTEPNSDRMMGPQDNGLGIFNESATNNYSSINMNHSITGHDLGPGTVIPGKEQRKSGNMDIMEAYMNDVQEQDNGQNETFNSGAMSDVETTARLNQLKQHRGVTDTSLSNTRTTQINPQLSPSMQNNRALNDMIQNGGMDINRMLSMQRAMDNNGGNTQQLSNNRNNQYLNSNRAEQNNNKTGEGSLNNNAYDQYSNLSDDQLDEQLKQLEHELSSDINLTQNNTNQIDNKNTYNEYDKQLDRGIADLEDYFMKTKYKNMADIENINVKKLSKPQITELITVLNKELMTVTDISDNTNVTNTNVTNTNVANTNVANTLKNESVNNNTPSPDIEKEKLEILEEKRNLLEEKNKLLEEKNKILKEKNDVLRKSQIFEKRKKEFIELVNSEYGNDNENKSLSEDFITSSMLYVNESSDENDSNEHLSMTFVNKEPQQKNENDIANVPISDDSIKTDNVSDIDNINDVVNDNYIDLHIIPSDYVESNYYNKYLLGLSNQYSISYAKLLSYKLPPQIDNIKSDNNKMYIELEDTMKEIEVDHGCYTIDEVVDVLNTKLNEDVKLFTVHKNDYDRITINCTKNYKLIKGDNSINETLGFIQNSYEGINVYRSDEKHKINRIDHIYMFIHNIVNDKPFVKIDMSNPINEDCNIVHTFDKPLINVSNIEIQFQLTDDPNKELLYDHFGDQSHEIVLRLGIEN